MKKVRISDVTLRECAASAGHNLSFKEKIEIAKLMDKLHCDIIQMPEIKNTTTDVLLIKTIASLIEHSAIIVAVGNDIKSVETAWNSVKGAKKPALKVSIPVSPVQMEYHFGKKPPVVLETAKELVKECKKYTNYVEFSAVDAIRSERQFLVEIIKAVIEAGVSKVNICDNEGSLFPEEMAEFIRDLYKDVPELSSVTLSVEISDKLGLATAAAFSAIDAGAEEVKTVIDGFSFPTIEGVTKLFAARGDSIKITSKIRTTEIGRTIEQMKRFLASADETVKPAERVTVSDDKISLTPDDDVTTVTACVKKLGYELSDEDNMKVFSAFQRAVEKKGTIGTKDLEAIIASYALQVPEIYTVDSYVINSGNIITATANIRMLKDGEVISGVGVGDGPVDASFRAIEQIVGHRYELDDFQIRAVTEGREAIGSSLVRLRSSSGKLYSGTGISTDIVGASIRAYVSAINKIAYEEE